MLQKKKGLFLYLGRPHLPNYRETDRGWKQLAISLRTSIYYLYRYSKCPARITQASALFMVPVWGLSYLGVINITTSLLAPMQGRKDGVVLRRLPWVQGLDL